MASITDCVVEGLKYPFNDLKKLLSLGALCAILGVISELISIKSAEISRTVVLMFEKTYHTTAFVRFSQLPANDMNTVIILSIVSFIISLFIMGYLYKVVNFSIEKKEDLPEFNNILDIFIKGIKYFLVILTYNIPAIILLFVGIMLGGAFMMIFTAIAMILFIAAFFLQIMALTNMVAHDSLKKAFDLKEITDNIANFGWGKYLGIILFTIIVFMIVNVAAGLILGFIATIFSVAVNHAIAVSIFVAILEGLFITSYASVFFNRVCGSIYGEAIK